MTKYRIFRAIRTTENNIDFSNIGVSWAIDEIRAIEFGRQFNEKFIVISALVSDNEINIAQTNAQWESIDYSNEGEVVLKKWQDIQVEVEGKVYLANTGGNDTDETRPSPIECEPSYITDYLNNN